MKRPLEQQVKEKARALGFEACGIAAPVIAEEDARGLEAFVRRGWHGSMDWLAETLERRRDPRQLLPEARAAIVCAMSYGPPSGEVWCDPLARAAQADLANISLYALRRDYHDVIKGKLKHLAQWLHARTGAEMRVFVDTAPLLERPLTEAARLGWRGKHTCVVEREEKFCGRLHRPQILFFKEEKTFCRLEAARRRHNSIFQ